MEREPSRYFIPNAHTSQRAKATRSNSQKARSRQYLPNKKDPSFDESSLWSGRRGSNSRHPPWQGGILPLNYPRIGYSFIVA